MTDLSHYSLAGSVATVVGTSPNIGTGIALRLAAAGAAVACVDRNEQIAKLAAEEIRREGGKAFSIACDVTSEEDVAAAVSAISGALGPIDVLVNGPVVYLEKSLQQMTLAEWRGQLAVILDGTFLVTRYVTDALIAAGRPGSVINLISTAGHQGETGNIGYTTAKGGILNLTRAMAMELAPHGIRVNSLTPTATDPTEGIERSTRWGVPGTKPEHIAALKIAATQLPMGAMPSPSDYGDAAVYLASPAARWVTGIDLPVDAGSLAKYWRVKSAAPGTP